MSGVNLPITECEDCYKVKCRGCGWEPDESQYQLIKKEILIACPLCSWSPRDELSK